MQSTLRMDLAGVAGRSKLPLMLPLLLQLDSPLPPNTGVGDLLVAHPFTYLKRT